MWLAPTSPNVPRVTHPTPGWPTTPYRESDGWPYPPGRHVGGTAAEHVALSRYLLRKATPSGTVAGIAEILQRCEKLGWDKCSGSGLGLPAAAYFRAPVPRMHT